MEERNGFYLYRVDFIYQGKAYTTYFESTAEITADSNPLVAWSIADDAIKEVLNSIKDRKSGLYPHGIVISGDFGKLTVKE